MHKKSLETQGPGKPETAAQPSSNQKLGLESDGGDAVAAAAVAAVEERTVRSASPISKEELRENSIAALRAKAQEHSAKVLGTVPCTDRLERKQHEPKAGEEKDSERIDPREDAKSPQVRP